LSCWLVGTATLATLLVLAPALAALLATLLTALTLLLLILVVWHGEYSYVAWSDNAAARAVYPPKSRKDI
jgi:hypothetical protein